MDFSLWISVALDFYPFSRSITPKIHSVKNPQRVCPPHRHVRLSVTHWSHPIRTIVTFQRAWLTMALTRFSLATKIIRLKSQLSFTKARSIRGQRSLLLCQRRWWQDGGYTAQCAMDPERCPFRRMLAIAPVNCWFCRLPLLFSVFTNCFIMKYKWMQMH